MHDQQWNWDQAGLRFGNQFTNLTPNLSLQVPSGLSTKLFPPLANLFGDLTAFTLYFNGPVDNSKASTADPNNLSMTLLAKLGSQFEQNLNASGPFSLEIDLGFQAIPTQTVPNAWDEGSSSSSNAASILVTQAVIQALINTPGHKNITQIQGIVPLTGNTLNFSLGNLGGTEGVAVPVSDLYFLFDEAFLQGHIPSAFLQNKGVYGFFNNIGLINLTLSLNIPPRAHSSGSHSSQSTLSKGLATTSSSSANKSRASIQKLGLEVGYSKNGPIIAKRLENAWKKLHWMFGTIYG